MDVTIRKIQKQEYPLLDHFLYEAIFVPEGIDPPPKTIIATPESTWVQSSFSFCSKSQLCGKDVSEDWL